GVRRGVRRGEIWTAADGVSDFGGKPRPVVVIQDDRFEGTESITVCPFTTSTVEAPLIRLDVEPNEVNGLDRPSRLMVDRVTTLRRSRLGERIGRLDDADMLRLGRAIMVFLGFAGAGRFRSAPDG